MIDDFTAFSERRQKLVRLLRTHDVKALAEHCRTAAADDLDWLLQAIDNVMSRLSDKIYPVEFESWQNMRRVVVSALHNRHNQRIFGGKKANLRGAGKWTLAVIFFVSAVAFIIIWTLTR